MASLITFHGNADFVKMLVDAEAEFLIVGGLAVVFYKCRNPSNVGDLDLLLNPSSQNAERFISVLSSPNPKNLFNLELCRLPSASQVAKANFRISLKFDSMLDIDVFTPPEDMSFGQLFSRSEHALLNDNIRVRVVSRLDLIDMKRRAVRMLSGDKKKHEDDLRCLEVV
jgi:hypothetical protein